MSERLYILHLDSQQHRDRFLTAIASLPGFVCFGNGEWQGDQTQSWMAAQPSMHIASDGQSCDDIELQLEQVGARLKPGQKLAGIFEYEAGYGIEKALRPLAPAGARPAIRAAHYGWFLTPTADPLKMELHLSSEADPDVTTRLEQLVMTARTSGQEESLTIAPFSQDEPGERFKGNVLKILDYIVAGDCYQVNLSHRFQARYQGNLWLAYQHLTRRFPTAHSAYVSIDGDPVLSISPESFLEIDQGHVVTRPIKGTRPRGKTPEDDQKLAQDLLTSPKDRAENIMIVDLLRNDLGRFCQPGTIRADQILYLESYRNVHHLVSTVTGELDPAIHPVKALAQGFPGGSITGAPKIRAMEIIRELEVSPRGPYCGSVFAMNPRGDLYSNIAIRTLYARGDTLYCHGGGGIVADSNPDSELQETLDKVGPLMNELNLAFGTAENKG
ncbi:anthranilate synthase component I family protein [Marinobacter zhejiangensis]|uniref:Para-aminobenzoate synthetase component 1 n=1 Tax=Marinobacter zhejiangensis TaxID=488535 RepID=A0A1I4RS12_9GAMM|nr:anthranilate synthase component I family protein [Marinobacter zhejiangensis]SFM54998.1 para-aminobenzoate synthetase component 1 [Marinobacter zhejiangensis]